MAEQKLVKFVYDNQETDMHYVVYKGDYVVLTKTKSKKVNYVRKHGTMKLSFDIKSPIFEVRAISIMKDIEYIEKVYNYMLLHDNYYFNDGFDDLCALKIHK